MATMHRSPVMLSNDRLSCPPEFMQCHTPRIHVSCSTMPHLAYTLHCPDRRLQMMGRRWHACGHACLACLLQACRTKRHLAPCSYSSSEDLSTCSHAGMHAPAQTIRQNGTMHNLITSREPHRA